MFFIIKTMYLLLSSAICTRSLGDASTGVINRMVRGDAERRLPCVAISLGNAAVKAVASTANRCFLGGLPRNRFALSIDTMNCGSRRHGIILGHNGALRRGFRLRRSVITLSKIMIATGHGRATQHLTPALIGIIAPGLFRRAGSRALSRKLTFRPNIQIRASYRGYNCSRIHVGKLSKGCARVLVSSHPVFSSLTNICKLRRVPTGVVRHIRIIHKNNSTLFNSSTVTKAIGVVAGRPVHGSNSFSRAVSGFSNSNSFSGGAALGLSLISSSDGVKTCICNRDERHST